MARQLVPEITASLNSSVSHDGNGQAGQPLKPIRREQYLHRFGSAATLMTVETFAAADGSRRTRRRFAPWPGL